MVRHILRARGRPPTDFASRSSVTEAEAAALPAAAGREEDRPEDEPLSDFQAEMLDHQAGARPLSEVTGGPQGGTPGEDEDGLNEVERALREAAESPIGRKELGED